MMKIEHAGGKLRERMERNLARGTAIYLVRDLRVESSRVVG